MSTRSAQENLYLRRINAVIDHVRENLKDDLSLDVLARVAGLSFERTTMAILPWLAPLLLSLAVITYMPKLVLWLPKMFF